jgi:hypothetical protein
LDLGVVHGGGGNCKSFFMTRGIKHSINEIDLNAIILAPNFSITDCLAGRFPVLGEGTFLKLMAKQLSNKYNLHAKILLTGYSRIKKSLIAFLTLTALLSICVQVRAQFAKDDPFLSYRVASPYQADSTTLRVLLPEKIVPGKSYQVLYILPVIENEARRFGDGLFEVLQYDFHNKYDLICVAPEFSSLPWYANHETDMNRQDEDHFLNTVIPFIDRQYPTLKSAEGRLLIGFSKSGWGAFSLLLRHPDIFYKSAGWDTGIRIDTGPIEEEERSKRIEQIFGSKKNFENYRLSTLLKQRGKLLGDEVRLFYYNVEGKRGLGGADLHRLLVELDIPHRYLFEPKRKHRWDSGWIPEAVSFLVDGDQIYKD